jgi:hypothetical protein
MRDKIATVSACMLIELTPSVADVAVLVEASKVSRLHVQDGLHRRPTTWLTSFLAVQG